ncbi:MAG: fumarylacetoacetate hydrolase family protein [Cupriavidus necator]
MRFTAFEENGQRGLAVEGSSGLRGLLEGDQGYPGDLLSLIQGGRDALAAAHLRLGEGRAIDPARIRYLPPLARPPKIICVGLNYAAHTEESPYEQPSYPTVFLRAATTLIGHGAPIVRPLISEQLDYEGELVAVIGTGGRHITKANALNHVVGYSIFNEASIRDYQFKTPQWTVGKNFDSTGAFGPVFVTADELPPGGKGLWLETRLNGKVVQRANTNDMLFDVAEVVSVISEAMTLEPGDVIATGTPAGVGFGRRPPLYMKAGDTCVVEIEGVGVLTNPIVDEAPLEAA